MTTSESDNERHKPIKSRGGYKPLTQLLSLITFTDILFSMLLNKHTTNELRCLKL
ncbi:hypothetical protein Bpfe_022752, partial [Biomphalaria pfeifferi]